MSENNQNEIAEPDTDTRDSIVLKLSRNPWKLSIGGTITEIDLAVCVLEQALRYLKLQAYFGAVADQSRMARDNQRVQSILDRARPQ